jgi:hypothetical protein
VQIERLAKELKATYYSASMVAIGREEVTLEDV